MMVMMYESNMWIETSKTNVVWYQLWRGEQYGSGDMQTIEGDMQL